MANVVEGTVRRDANRIRITIELVDAQTDELIWSEIYDRDLTDIFAIQEFSEAITLDPRNPGPISDLAYTLYVTRQFRASELLYDRLIDLNTTS